MTSTRIHGCLTGVEAEPVVDQALWNAFAYFNTKHLGEMRLKTHMIHVISVAIMDVALYYIICDFTSRLGVGGGSYQIILVF